MRNLFVSEETFGPLLEYINEDSITDICWNGEELWIDDLNKGRYKVNGIELSEKFVINFTTKIMNLMNVNFNKYMPLLEAETDNLRISIIHETVAKTGRSISIRKTPAKRRMNRASMLEDGYCLAKLDNFMHNAVLAHCNIVVSGLPGVGKTEYIKTLTQYIPANERAITIEDNLEIRYREINPGKDCVSLKVDDDFTYTDAIKACLRQKPTWILLSEARSVEVKSLLESMSTGTHCLTTIHAEDVRKIPNRIRNMMPSGENDKKVENDIYSFVDIGVLIQSRIEESGKIRRFISQVALYSVDDETQENSTIILYEDGKFVTEEIPSDIKRKFKMSDIDNPFEEVIIEEPQEIREILEEIENEDNDALEENKTLEEDETLEEVTEEITDEIL